MQLCGFAYLVFFAASGGECVICHGKCCGCPCYQRLEVIPNDCECPADRDTEDVGRVVWSLCLNLARAVVCHAEQPVVAVSNLSKPFFYSGSSFLARGLFSYYHYSRMYIFTEILLFIFWWQI